jgi:hypothetical protein
MAQSEIRGRLYNRIKKAEGGRADRTFGEDKMSTPKTAEHLAEQHGVDERTIRRDGQFADAIWFGLGANKANAHPMTAADKKHAVIMALQTFVTADGEGKSQRQIADQVGCAQSYVTRVKQEMQVNTGVHLSTSYTPVTTTVGKDGKSYPATRTPKTPGAASGAPKHPQHDEIVRRLQAGQGIVESWQAYVDGWPRPAIRGLEAR